MCDYDLIAGNKCRLAIFFLYRRLRSTSPPIKKHNHAQFNSSNYPAHSRIYAISIAIQVKFRAFYLALRPSRFFLPHQRNSLLSCSVHFIRFISDEIFQKIYQRATNTLSVPIGPTNKNFAALLRTMYGRL